MASVWAVAKALRYPIDVKLKGMNYIPYTISFVIRKRIQVDSMYELPKEKRPPEKMLWEGSSKEIDEWFDKVFKNKPQQIDGLVIDISEVE